MLSKEDKKIKNWGIHPHFYNKWVQNLTFSWTYWYIKNIVLPNVAKTTKRSFFLLYSICHQVQGHLHLDKSIVSGIESLITTQCVLFCPYVGNLPFWKIKKVWFLFHCKSSIVILSIHIYTLFYFKIEKNKKERQGNKKNNNLILRKMIIMGLELTISESRGQCAYHCATKWFKTERVFVL